MRITTSWWWCRNRYGLWRIFLIFWISHTQKRCLDLTYNSHLCRILVKRTFKIEIHFLYVTVLLLLLRWMKTNSIEIITKGKIFILIQVKRHFDFALLRQNCLFKTKKCMLKKLRCYKLLQTNYSCLFN